MSWSKMISYDYFLMKNIYTFFSCLTGRNLGQAYIYLRCVPFFAIYFCLPTSYLDT